MMKYSITIFSLCFFLIIACSVTTFAEAENTNKGYTAFNTYNAGKVTYYSYSRNDVVPFTVEQLKEINEFIQKYFESAFPNFRSYGVTEIHLSAEAFDNVRLS